MHANYSEVQQLAYGVQQWSKGISTKILNSSHKLRDVDLDGN